MRALAVTDIQNDFMPGGAYAVPDGDAVIEPANRLIQHFELVVATQDWHPPNHGSFAVNHKGFEVGDEIELNGLPQILCPVHCLADTFGSDFHPNLDMAYIKKIFHKGTDANIDNYSGFFDNGHRRSTGMGEYLLNHEIDELYILGVATDHCVRHSVLDALRMGFRVSVIEDACRGIEGHEGDSARAIEEMRRTGARIVHSSDIFTSV